MHRDMAQSEKATEQVPVKEASGYDYHNLPDFDNDFVDEEAIQAFAEAIKPASALTTSPSEEDLLTPQSKRTNAEFITALNDWRPVRQRRIRPKVRKGAKGQRRDETREGWTYGLVKYPLLFFVCGWIAWLGICYLLTRFYIYLYEQYVTWRGARDRLRKQLRVQRTYEGWVEAAKDLDDHLENDEWKKTPEGSYDFKTVSFIGKQLKKLREEAQKDEEDASRRQGRLQRSAIDELRTILETCVKNNFAGIESSRLYCETYYGTKDLIQNYIDETSASLRFLFQSEQISDSDKRDIAQHLSANFGRTALCLSGGATFAYYHFGIAKALLDTNLLPNIITGTSGGALVAGLLATRTEDELKKLLVPALAHRITACRESFSIWFRRWRETGARFDSLEWAKACSWFCHGSLTFREAYQRTGRILNVSCVPSDPHSPTILCNYRTTPDCVIWSAVIASAAVPGILNPVVLMKKQSDGTLTSFSFGTKWKDGSLRTDIPLKSLNLHFNVNFSIVSQVNPHVSLWFFSSRGTVGRPVTHRRGRGWRGGFLGSAIEQFIKLDLNKWLKVLRHLELLPRPLGQDWSEVFLQRFSGTITIWPKTKISDFWHILSDPSPQRLDGMIRAGQLAAWPKLKFISNRMAIEKVIEEAKEATRPAEQPFPTPMPKERLRSVLSEEDLQGLLAKARENDGVVEVPPSLLTPAVQREPSRPLPHRQDSPSFAKRFSNLWGSLPSPRNSTDTVRPASKELPAPVPMDDTRRSSMMDELVRQSRVFFDDFADESEAPSDAEGIQYETGTEDEEEGGSETDVAP